MFLFVWHNPGYPLEELVEGIIAAVGAVPSQKEVHVLTHIQELRVLRWQEELPLPARRKPLAERHAPLTIVKGIGGR